MSFTYTEIKDQYNSLRKTFDHISSIKDDIIKFYEQNSPKSLTFLGCGSSYYLCQSGELSSKMRLGINSSALAAGDLMLNFKQYKKLLEGTMIVTLSRSGSTSEVINAVQNVKKELNVPVLAITCLKNSKLSKKVDFTIELPWAFDDSVCQTRTVTNLYTANLLILAYILKDYELVNDINKAIEQGDMYMASYEEALKDIAGLDWTNTIILADGELQGIAAEGAIAFTEISKVNSHYYHVLDVRHGPMVMIDKDTLVIACLSDDDYEYQSALINDLLKREAKVVIYRDKFKEKIENVALNITSNTRLDNAVRGIPFIFIIQLIAYCKAMAKGLNPDTPDGLDAWISL